MKKISLFVSALALIAAFASCSKTPEGTPSDGSKDPGTSVDPSAEPVKSNKCDIVSFAVLVDGNKVEADISAVEKKVVIAYAPEYADGVKSALAEYTLSEGATISPDPAKEALDYTKDLSFTITAQDGTTTKAYSVSSRQFEVTLRVNKISGAQFSQLKVAAAQDFDQNYPMVAFCGVDKFATPDLQVFDLDFNKVGDMNKEGIPANWYVTSITSDANGVVLATLSQTTDTPTAIDNYREGGIYIWKDGWDQKPYEFWKLGPEDNTPQFPNGKNNDFCEIAIGGTVDSDCVITTYHWLGWKENPGEGMYNCWAVKGGDLANPSYTVAKTLHTATDGNCWQMLAPVSGDINGLFICCDTDEERNCLAVYVQQGIAPTSDDELFGSLTSDFVGEEGAEGATQYGNFRVGHVYPVNYHGDEFVIVSSAFWDGGYITIQTLDPTDDVHFIYPTNYVDKELPFNAPRVSSAAIFDAEKDVVNIMFCNARFGGSVYRYEISRELI
ncbi:MAG: DUF5018 domain-containing protein [Bacteroidales bacterium]|nr:DUF5018 domain-containing protein [Bacteroidales bacterium]